MTEPSRKPRESPDSTPDPLPNLPRDVEPLLDAPLNSSSDTPHEDLDGQLNPDKKVGGFDLDDLAERALIPRLKAAEQLLNLIESVKAAEPEGPVDATATSDDEFFIDPRNPLGKYRLLQELGRGGMGVVFRARDPQLERDIAIKVLSSRRMANPEWLLRFQREARAASALNHPNILTVFEIGESHGQHFLATELVEGMTLRQRIAAGPIGIQESLAYAEQMGSALAAAHAVGIVHRDLKPDNVMIRRDGLLKILDFGLAKQVVPLAPNSTTGFSGMEPFATRLSDAAVPYASLSGTIIGTVRYMSPEQARGLPVDPRTDIFSLGVVLYELLTGCHPFEGETSSDVLAAILDRAPIPMSQHLRSIPADLVRVVLKCLSKNRDQRYGSIRDLMDDLERVTSVGRSGNASARSAVDIEEEARESVRDGQVQSGPFAAMREPEIPRVSYAASGDINIAYQVLGDGPFDLVFVMGWVSHLEWFWREPSFAAFLRRLATFSRVILFDKRGTGLSDKVPVDQLPTLEQRMDDVRAVMEAVGSERAVLCGISEGGPMCALFSATYPEKTIALTMIGCYARRLWAQDYPWGPTEAQRQRFLDEIRRTWGGPVGIDDRAPSRARDPQFRDWWAAYLRMGASPGAALALTNMNAQIDVRPVLPLVQVPTLVIHRTGDRCLRVEEGRYLADHIPGSKWVELPGADHLPFVGDQEAILSELEEFLTGVRQPLSVDRVLATVIHVAFEPDSAASDRTNEGTTSRTQTLAAHIVRAVDLFRGRNLRLDRDLAIALFDGPARAVRAAIAVCDSARRLGVRVRIGVHTGECDVVQNLPSGKTVDLARDIARRGAFGDVLVTATVRDLIVGSGLPFVEHSNFDAEGQDLALFQVAR